MQNADIGMRYFCLVMRHVHDLYHKCTSEIEAAWNEMANSARYHTQPNGYECYIDIRQYGSTDMYEVTTDTCIKCSICPDKHHDLRVLYIHNPRDADLLAWYLNNVKMDYTML